jgi:predicted dehydrogenase
VAETGNDRLMVGFNRRFAPGATFAAGESLSSGKSERL